MLSCGCTFSSCLRVNVFDEGLHLRMWRQVTQDQGRRFSLHLPRLKPRPRRYHPCLHLPIPRQQQQQNRSQQRGCRHQERHPTCRLRSHLPLPRLILLAPLYHAEEFKVACRRQWRAQAQVRLRCPWLQCQPDHRRQPPHRSLYPLKLRCRRLRSRQHLPESSNSKNNTRAIQRRTRHRNSSSMRPHRIQQGSPLPASPSCPRAGNAPLTKLPAVLITTSLFPPGPVNVARARQHSSTWRMKSMHGRALMYSQVLAEDDVFSL